MTDEEKEALIQEIVDRCRTAVVDSLADELDARGAPDGSLLLELLRAREDVQNVDAFLRRLERMILIGLRRAGP